MIILLCSRPLLSKERLSFSYFKKGASGKGRKGSGTSVGEGEKKGGKGDRTPDIKSSKKGCKGKSTPVAVKKLRG